ncbi:MAG: class I SAM-dependent methyltransferase [Thermoanaerobaculia bacterium]
MGIPRGTARLLLDEARRRPFTGTLLELGRMTVYVTGAELDRWAAEQSVALASDADLRLSHQPELARLGCLDDVSFFRRLGFSAVESSDVSDWEGADRILDLNRPVPVELHGRYDAVFEAGTIQHVFDLPQVFANIHSLLRPGGRVIHGMAPSSNHVDHGFYMFSPTLFADFYRENGWEIEAFYFFEFRSYWWRGRFRSTVWKVRPYAPGCLDDSRTAASAARSSESSSSRPAPRRRPATGCRSSRSSGARRRRSPREADRRRLRRRSRRFSRP